jgi:NACHT C-terminal Alpha/Beta 2
VLLGLPPAQRDPYFLQELVRGYAYAPAEAAEEVLFKLAEADPRFYFDHEWRDSVRALDTASSARRLIDLVTSGALSGKSSSDDWHLVRQLGGLIVKHADLRRHVYGLLKDGATTPGLAMLAGAIAESPDEEGLLVLVRSGQGNPWRTIEKAVTEHVPVDGYQNAYSVIPVPAVELRRKLLAMTTDGGPTDVAARWLNHIDSIRDQFGLPEGEPRHPDLSSSKPWPIMTPDPDATAD